MPFGTEIVNIHAHSVWSLDYICCYKHGTRSNLQSYMRKISLVHYLGLKCESWKFPDWESIKLLDLPYLHVGIIPFKIFPFGTSYFAVSNAAPPVSRCFSPPPAIQLELLQYPRIFVYLTGFLSVWKRTPYRGILSSFYLNFSDLVCRKYVLFLVSFSRCDTNFKTIRLIFKFPIKTSCII